MEAYEEEVDVEEEDGGVWGEGGGWTTRRRTPYTEELGCIFL
jgi:hypothetical protein